MLTERKIDPVTGEAISYAQSMLHQLDKLEKYSRRFVYYVEREQGFRKQRPHTIHVNMEKDATARDVFESYYFARLLDRNLSEHLISS